jgi:CheY-like chemotaxis protein
MFGSMRNRICASGIFGTPQPPQTPPKPDRCRAVARFTPFRQKVAFAMPNDVLIVEDDAIIAIDFEATILDLGVQQVRTAVHAADALAMIAERAPDFALLDVGLGNDTSFEVADRLDALKIPYAFVTGYRADVALASRFAGRPVLSKPCLREELEAVLRGSPEPAE